MRRTTHIIARCLLVVAIALGFGLSPSKLMAQATIVDIATDTSDPSNLADTEPSIAVNPTNTNEIVVVSFSENWGPGVMAPVWRSTNGGTTWQKVPRIPQPSLPGPPPVPQFGPGDQKVAFDATGHLFVAELGQDGGIHDFVYRQTGAATAPLTAGAAYGDDQPHLDVDRTTSHTCSGRLYSPWLNFGVSSERSTVSNSNNSGASMTDVGVGDNSAHANRTTRIALAPDGAAYVVYKTREGAVAGVHLPGSSNNDFENVHFRVKRSDDCGTNWNALGAAGASVHGNNTVQTFFTSNFGVIGGSRKVARARSSDAWIAVDPTNGDVYAAYVSRDASTFGQIYVARSTDRGATWTSHRVTDGTHHSAYPEIAVAGNRTVGVLYVDFLDTGSATSFRHHFARSFDQGQTWSDEILQAMDPVTIANAQSGFLWGDYEGLTAAGNRFYGVFTGRSINRTTTQLDPIFFAETSVPANLHLIKSKTNPSLCMGVKHKVSEGANVQLYDCTATDVHKNWNIATAARTICQTGDDGVVYCIDFRAGAVDAIVTQEAAWKDNQKWLYAPADKKFHGHDPSLCLDVESQSPNSQVKVTKCEDWKQFQTWEIQ